jgi:hypothetical protein
MSLVCDAAVNFISFMYDVVVELNVGRMSNWYAGIFNMAS